MFECHSQRCIRMHPKQSVSGTPQHVHHVRGNSQSHRLDPSDAMDTVEQTSSLRFLTHLLDQLDLAVDDQFADRPPSDAVLRRKTTLGSSVVRDGCNQPLTSSVRTSSISCSRRFSLPTVIWERSRRASLTSVCKLGQRHHWLISPD
jgi:hypothetical protein